MLKTNPITIEDCDCGRGIVYTGPGEIITPRIDGKAVCDECYAEYLRDRYSLQKDV